MQPAFIKSFLATLAIVLCVSAILIEARKMQGNGKKKGRAAGTQQPRVGVIMSGGYGDQLPARCHRIPSNFSMCYHIGYDYMRVPTILQHDSVDDASIRARDFNAMLRFKCHPHLRRFLCSLFASICIPSSPEVEVMPCKSLCLDVRNSCERNLAEYGYQWPNIFNCSNFPDGNACLGIENDTENLENIDEECTPCSESYDLTNVLRKACVADIIFRTKRLRHEVFQQQIEVNASLIAKNIIKSPLALTNSSQIAMTILETGCNCSRMKANAGSQQDFLIMAERDREGRNVISFVMSIAEAQQQKLFKFLSSTLRNANFTCPVSQQELKILRDRFYGNPDANKKTSAQPNTNKNGNKGNKNGARQTGQTTGKGRNQKNQRIARQSGVTKRRNAGGIPIDVEPITMAWQHQN